MILDDENIQIGRCESRASLEFLCKYIGKLYITKNKQLGYILNFDEKGRPKTIIKSDYDPIDLEQLNNSRCLYYNDWIIPNKHDIIECVGDWDVEDDGETISYIIQNFSKNCDHTSHHYNYHLRTKRHTVGFISNIQGTYWLGDSSGILLEIGKFNDKFKIGITNVINLFRKDSIKAKTIYMYNIPEDQRQTIEESDKLIEEELNSLPILYEY